MVSTTDLLEALMILCFGMSWPAAIYKSWKSRTAKGKSLFFQCIVWVGYIFGITRKFMLWGTATAPLGWLFYLGWAFYFLNITEITIDTLLYFRNVRLDKARDSVQS